jgi:splicing factor 3B subunit 2
LADVTVEVVPEVLHLSAEMSQVSDIFERFQERTVRKLDQEEEINGEVEMDLDEEELEPSPEEVRQSKKKQRKANRMTVAQLKQIVAKPDVVEVRGL